MKRFLLAGALLAFTSAANGQIISTVAGNASGCCSGFDTGSYSGDTGPATAAGLYWPLSIALDAGGSMYIADHRNNRIRRVSNTGIITTVAGNGYSSGYPYYTGGFSGDGGPATAAELNNPGSVAVDVSGNIYIVDGGSRIRKVNTSGIISTVAGNGTLGYSGDGGPATSAQLSANSVYVDASGNLYIAAQFRIRKVNTSGIISTIAGTGTVGYSGDGGPATNAKMVPVALDLDASGNIYVADNTNYVIRKINTLGIISTVVGNGTSGYSGDGGQATAAQISQPTDIKVDASGNLYITEDNNQIIRKVNTSNIISTVAGIAGAAGYSGDGGPATSAKLRYPHSVAINGSNMFIADQDNNVIRKVTLGSTTGVDFTQTVNEGFSISPNPNNGQFTITIKSVANEMGNVVISNSIGQKITKFSINTNDISPVKLDVSPGIYFITATTNKERYFGKVVIE